ncbi:MAG TPA: helix-turn-helix domain-containing protein [Candidatus Thermoplasmatota archaeon]|nr:helix-turn-helix domain-containing protein [Candidatus Thermoplasmatota archaeon]
MGPPLENRPAPRVPEASIVRLHQLDPTTGRSLEETQGLLQVTQLGLAPDPLRPNVLLAPPGEGPLDTEAALLQGGVLVLTGLAILALLGAAFYTRLARSTLLDQEVRASVYEAVRAEPGIHALALQARLDRPRRVVDYHLDVLVREGFLAVLEEPGFRRYFLRGSLTPGEMRHLAALRHPAARAVYEAIRDEPNLGLGDLAARTGISLPHASKTVKKLVEAGLVERRQEGRAVTLRVHEPR